MTGLRRNVLTLATAVLAVAGVRAVPPPATRTIDLGNGVRMEFVLVAPGAFTMGSVPDDGDGDEKPQHKVKLTRAYYIGKYEVTQRQWAAVMPDNPSQFRGEDLPVDSVSWDDCQRFLTRAAAKAGVTLRLPTEAQWEFACRAGTTTRWPWGADEAAAGDYAWIELNSSGTTHAVGRKKPNAWGLYDVCGNVAEWCQDWYANPYPPGDATDPVGPASGVSRVLRGGTWSDNPFALRSAARNCIGPSLRTSGTGFRCVLLVPASP